MGLFYLAVTTSLVAKATGDNVKPINIADKINAFFVIYNFFVNILLEHQSKAIGI